MLDALLGAPVIVKVLGAPLLILVVNRFCKHLIISVAVGALALALWSGHSPSAIPGIAWRGFSSTSNLLLIVVVVQVIWLSSQMSATGVMKDLLTGVRAVVSQRGAMAVLPAVIGLLPMPGGALFSAPLVDSCDPDGTVAPQLKAQTNHWFRHIWEYWWPLYPGVLLAIKYTGLEVWQFMMLGIPLSLCAIGAGYVLLIRRMPPGSGASSDPKGAGPAPGFFGLLLPIIVVIACYAAISGGYAGARRIWPELPEMNRYIPMLIGLCSAMSVLQCRRPLSGQKWKSILLAPRALSMVAIVAAVLVYGAFIGARLPGGEPLVERMHAEMEDWGIPLIAIVMLLPLISGLSTGISVGFVGASFPIVLSLLGQDPSLRLRLSTTVLAYGFGHIGMLLSPVHVCLVVTSAHFRTQVLRNAAGLLKPAAIVLACAVLMHFLIG